MNQTESGTPHMDARRRAIDGIRASLAGGLAADSNGGLISPRQWSYDKAGNLAAVTGLAVADPTAATTTETATTEPSTAGPVIPAAGIGQGVRNDPPRPEPTVAEQMRLSTERLFRLMVGRA